jgi:hypothetical protein
MVTSIRRFVGFVVCELLTSPQSVEAKAGFSCRTNGWEGIVQLNKRSLSDFTMFRKGSGAVRVAKIPVGQAAAAAFVPSAEHATAHHTFLGAAACVHVAPVSSEIRMGPGKLSIVLSAAAIITLCPSAEHAAVFQYSAGTRETNHVFPKLVETQTCPVWDTAKILVPSAEQATAAQ